MSLTFPANYAAALKNKSLEENWYIKLYYGDESNFLGLSDIDISISSTRYYGLVEQWGEIYEEINIAESKASVSECSIVCLDTLKNGTLSAELYGGSNKYLNRKVEIFSYIASTSFQIFLGKLINISVSENSVMLVVESVMPWDGITIPTQRNDDNFIEPLAYGNYARNAIDEDTKSAFGRTIDSKVYPVPFNLKTGYSKKIWHMLTPRAVSGENANLHHYEKEVDKFFRIVDPATMTASTSHKSAESVYYGRDLDRTFLLRPIEEYETVASTFGDGTVESAIDWEPDGFTDGTDEEQTVTEHNSSLPTGNQTVTNLRLSFPKLPGDVTALEMYYKIRIDCTNQVLNDGSSQSVTITDETWSDGSTIIQWTEVDGTGTLDTNDLGAGDGLNGDYKMISHTASLGANGDTLPEYVNVQVDWLATYNAGTVTDEFTAKVEIYDVYALITIGYDWTSGDFDALTNKIDDMEFMYASSDGMAKSYSGGSGTAIEVHEVHRDLLARFTDFDFADGSFPNWSDLDTARSGWNVRWWLLEQRPLIEVLEQLQFEGCFIFKPKIDGSGGKHIWIDGTEPTEEYTLNEESYTNLALSLTDMSELRTDVTYNWQRHAAKNDYLQSTNVANSTARTNWFKSVTNENKFVFDLDFLINCGDNTDNIYDTDSTDSDNLPNETIVVYYDNLTADPKIIISCEIKDFSKFNLEVGDYLQFNDSNKDPFGKSWASLWFIITETRRTKQNLGITAREVYES